jgi:hypothetical protein
MTMEDADRMLIWKNYPETRRFALATKVKIKPADHYRWLSDNLSSFRIILHRENVCGAIRVRNQEVSIWLDRACRGKGLAVAAIKKVSKRGYTARIARGNVPSMICFVRCGYWPVAVFETHCVLTR